MLKITLKIKCNFLLRNSNARSFRFYNRLFVFLNYFITNLFKTYSTVESSSVCLDKKTKLNLLTLMRSPFHYKVSKTILGTPIQIIYISFFLKCTHNEPVILSKLSNLNQLLTLSSNFIVTNMKIEHNKC